VGGERNETEKEKRREAWKGKREGKGNEGERKEGAMSVIGRRYSFRKLGNRVRAVVAYETNFDLRQP